MDCSRQPIDEVNSTGKGIRPVFSWVRGLSKECEAKFDDMPMFSLKNVVLLRGVGTRYSVHDASLVKKRGE